jgi:2-oxoisovalerate dehydrogenase E1 component subunit alpha
LTVLDDREAPPESGPGHPRAFHGDPDRLLPDPYPFRVTAADAIDRLGADHLGELYARMVLGRRFNQQASVLANQGKLATYPSSAGQEACQVVAPAVLRETDWLFPSYRDTLAVVLRGVDPVEALTLLRGNAHCGYDPRRHRVAPLTTPLATQAPHATGLAHAARLSGHDTVALALLGDGATSEGDFHEAMNFAAVLRAPVVFLVQNNGYAISVPLSKQSAAPTLAHKAIGYGIPGRLVDGNDVAGLHLVLDEAVERARAGYGPTLVEAITYRLEPHTNSDNAERYRSPEEVAAWRRHDPLTLLERGLRQSGALDDDGVAAAAAAAETFATSMRERFAQPAVSDPYVLLDHVYAEPTQQLREQAATLTSLVEGE